jgi:phosphatidylglycerophosphate synthase
VSVRQNMQALALAQKTPHGTPAYTLYVNRRIGRLIAAVAFERRMTPNQLTIISALLTLGGLAVLVGVDTSIWSSLVAALLLAVGFTFDSADGQLARLQGSGGPLGEWFDHAVDAGKTVGLHAAVLVAAYRFLDPPAGLLVLVLAFQFVAVVTYSSNLLSDLLQRSRGVKRSSAPPGRRQIVASVVKLPVDSGVVCWTVAIFGTALFWWAYGLLFVGSTAYLVAHVRHVVSVLSAPDPGTTPDVVSGSERAEVAS